MSANEISVELRQAVKDIKTAILQSQYVAAKSVNTEQLSLYFGIGRYISENSRKGFWGTGAIENISEQLQRELPGLRGFGVASIKNMRQFYETWAPFVCNPADGHNETAANPLSTADGFQNGKINIGLLRMSNRYLSVSDFEGFANIGFSHHLIIIRQAASLEERLFYIRQAYLNKWSKLRLQDMIKADLYHHQSALPNNFASTLPSPNSALKALEMFKDEYLLDFINVEEIGERDRADIDEREVEQAGLPRAAESLSAHTRQRGEETIRKSQHRYHSLQKSRQEYRGVPHSRLRQPDGRCHLQNRRRRAQSVAVGGRPTPHYGRRNLIIN